MMPAIRTGLVDLPSRGDELRSLPTMLKAAWHAQLGRVSACRAEGRDAERRRYELAQAEECRRFTRRQISAWRRLPEVRTLPATFQMSWFLLEITEPARPLLRHCGRYADIRSAHPYGGRAFRPEAQLRRDDERTYLLAVRGYEVAALTRARAGVLAPDAVPLLLAGRSVRALDAPTR